MCVFQIYPRLFCFYLTTKYSSEDILYSKQTIGYLISTNIKIVFETISDYHANMILSRQYQISKTISYYQDDVRLSRQYQIILTILDYLDNIRYARQTILNYQDNMFAGYFMTSKEKSHVQIMNLRNITFHVLGTPRV